MRWHLCIARDIDRGKAIYCRRSYKLTTPLNAQLRQLCKGKGAAAVVLSVQRVLLAEAYALVVAAALFEVGIQKVRAVFRRRPFARLVQQRTVFVGRNGKGGAEKVKALLLGVLCRGVKAHFKAGGAAQSPFPLIFQPLGVLQKDVVVKGLYFQFQRRQRRRFKIAAVYNFRQPAHLVQTFFPFCLRKNIVVVEVQRDVKGVQYSRQAVGGAGSAAHVQQKPAAGALLFLFLQIVCRS